MSFRDIIQSDTENVFFNTDEFAENHNINGKDIKVIIDNDQLIQRSKKEYDGISVGQLLFYVKAEEYGSKPEQGAPITFDNKQMIVFDVREDEGIYEIILAQNRGY